MQFSASVTTLSGGAWLSVSASSGTVQTPFLDVSVLSASINPAGLAPATYYGTIQIASSVAVNSPQSLTVILNVLPPDSKIGPQLYPGGLIFTGVAGANPSSQDVQVVNSTSGSNSYLSSKIGPLNFLPTNAVIQPDQPTAIPRLSGFQRTDSRHLARHHYASLRRRVAGRIHQCADVGGLGFWRKPR